jgi:hypothetical protein
VAVVGRLVQKQERDCAKGETIHKCKNNTKTQNTGNRKPKYKIKTNKKNIKKT